MFTAAVKKAKAGTRIAGSPSWSTSSWRSFSSSRASLSKSSSTASSSYSSSSSSCNSTDSSFRLMDKQKRNGNGKGKEASRGQEMHKCHSTTHAIGSAFRGVVQSSLDALTQPFSLRRLRNADSAKGPYSADETTRAHDATQDLRQSSIRCAAPCLEGRSKSKRTGAPC